MLGGQISSLLGPYRGDPGIGRGAPLNAEFDLKILIF
jgi:hypothetical protein